MSSTHEAPQRLGPYELERELGRGGQAVVWLALDTRIGRRVALKVLPPLGPNGAEIVRRLRREAQVMARLEHPAIAGVLDADLDRGTPYLALRYVAGETLAKRIASEVEAGATRPDAARLREIARFFETAARALHVAHEAGIVHRDVKPANLMVTPEGEPVVLDFGFARDDVDAAQSANVSGSTSGTPAYMSPEQLRGASTDRRTDVWSLGISLFEAATLSHPFAAVTREALFHAILEEEIPDPRRVHPLVGRDLATILETATAKDPNRRYRTALDLAEDLRRYGADEPILARPAGRIERAWRWARRKPARAASAAAITLLLLATLALLFYGIGASGRAEQEIELRALADAAREDAVRERARAEEAHSALAQIEADRTLRAALDELGMQRGTLWFGLDMKSSIAGLAPRYYDAFRAHGFDFDAPSATKYAGERLASMRARDAELASAFVGALRDVASMTADAADPRRANVLAVLAHVPAAEWAELDDAVARWSTSGEDRFGPLASDAVLATRSVEQIQDLAAAVIEVPGRLSLAESVLERALRREPGSFRLHYLIAAVGFMRAAQDRSDADASRRVAEKVLHHMRVCVALRPRSGFVRVMLANALAMSGDYQSSERAVDEAVELEPANALVWLFRARYYSFSPLHDEAIAACDRALELDPALPGARELRAHVLARAKR